MILNSIGRASGVRLTSGDAIAARQGVICSMTPDQLYGRLLRDQLRPAEVAAGLQVTATVRATCSSTMR